MENENLKILANDGLLLQGYAWLPKDEAKAVVCLIHGLGEHAARYAFLAQYFNQKDVAVYAYDQRGHGRSPGQRGHAHYEYLLEDIESMLKFVRLLHLESPIILYGHSWGGNLVSNYILKRKSKELTGAVLTSPWLELSFEPPAWQVRLGKILAGVLPALSQSNGLALDHLSRDPEIGKAYAADPMVHDRISIGLFLQIQKAGQWALAEAYRLKTPTLVLHGADDKITSASASRRFASSSPAQVTFRSWPEMRHETHNEIGKEEVMDFILDWIDELVRKQQ